MKMRNVIMTMMMAVACHTVSSKSNACTTTCFPHRYAHLHISPVSNISIVIKKTRRKKRRMRRSDGDVRPFTLTA